jgi:hypothetical protein
VKVILTLSEAQEEGSMHFARSIIEACTHYITSKALFGMKLLYVNEYELAQCLETCRNKTGGITR